MAGSGIHDDAQRFSINVCEGKEAFRVGLAVEQSAAVGVAEDLDAGRLRHFAGLEPAFDAHHAERPHEDLGVEPMRPPAPAVVSSVRAAARWTAADRRNIRFPPEAASRAFPA